MPELSPSQRSFVYCNGCKLKKIELNPDDPSTYDAQTVLDPHVLDLVHAFEGVMSEYLDLPDYRIVVRQEEGGLIISANFDSFDGDDRFEALGRFSDSGILMLTAFCDDEVLEKMESKILFVSSIAELLWNEKWADLRIEVNRNNLSNLINLRVSGDVLGDYVDCTIKYDLNKQ